MKIQELRIGNIVMVDNPKYHPRLDGIPLRVTGFEECVISSRSDHVVRLEHIKQKPDSFYESYSQFLKFIKPIPLTEEVLLKCGLTQKGSLFGIGFLDTIYWYNIENQILYIEYTDSPFSEDEGVRYPVSSPIKHLHVLMNIIYDLTGRGLEVKL